MIGMLDMGRSEMKVFKIAPLDPLFFRDPRPFTAGEQDWAGSFPFPWPGTVYGAIRSAILSRREYEKFLTEGYSDIGSPRQKGTFHLRALFLSQNGQYYFPSPVCILLPLCG